MRGRDGALRAFANTCRHRGARLLDGSGNCRAIRCPFHRWTYALDGRLLNAPAMRDAADLRMEEYGLVPVRLAASSGFAFVCLDQETGSLDQWLGEFAVVHLPWQLERIVPTRRREFEVACNWKCFMEVFNEYYHLPSVHPDTIGDLYQTPEPGDEVQGSFATQFGATTGTGALLESDQEHVLPAHPNLSGRELQGVRYTWIYPNVTFAAGAEGVWMYETYPLSPARTRVAMTACFAPQTVEGEGFGERARYYYERLDRAIDEDIPALENQQAGLSSPLARPGRFCERLEPSVARFAFWYAQRMLSHAGTLRPAG